MSEKWGLSHKNPEKNWAIHIFLLKKGANHIPGSAEKGGYSARTSVLCHAIYRTTIGHIFMSIGHKYIFVEKGSQSYTWQR